MTTTKRPAGVRITPSQANDTHRAGHVRRVTQVWAFLDTQDQPLRDSKGRRVHTRLHLLDETFTQPTPQQPKGWRYPIGTWPAYLPQLLREGQAYGACNQAVLFSTPELRDHEARKYVLAAARRAFKAAQARGGRQVFGSIRLESEVRA